MEMMQGVRLLDTVEVMGNTINWLTFWIVGLLLLCGSVIFVYKMATKQHDNSWYLVLILFAIVSFSMGVFLEENVDMQSFLDTYEIVKQEGHILTIKEK